MKTIAEIRRSNLLLAIERMNGSQTQLAEAAGVSPAYLSQVKTAQPNSKTGRQRSMGDDIARRIEKAIGEAEGWMDQSHDDDFVNPQVAEANQPLVFGSARERRARLLAETLLNISGGMRDTIERLIEIDQVGGAQREMVIAGVNYILRSQRGAPSVGQSKKKTK
ncbi:helix-turn-helix domain-containing protein [Mycetohabitans rhizoxinica]|nr:helix-turn-helix domain-containing protein [Mycetohabitans rhizoxinica]